MSKSVLIVEDEVVLREVYELLLSAKGHIVHTANNGIEGLKQIVQHKPDVVLLDMFMPLLSGRELLRNINLSDYPNTRVIVYSNLSDPETEAEVLQNGAEKFVLKSSMTPKDLAELVESTTTTVEKDI